MEGQGRRHVPLLILFLIISSFRTNSSLISVNSSQKVTLELYYETLCPYCSIFIVDYLYKIFNTGLIEIINLKLIPYGNAKIRPNSTIACQHGPYECWLNTIEACAIDVWPDVNAHFPFIYCVEKLIYEGKKTEWETCFEKLGLDQKPVRDCYENGRGKELELGYAAATNDLQPPHAYVPWVTVDGQPLYSDYRNFVTYICKAYKGTPVPSACGGLPAELSAADIISCKKGNMNILTPVCYTGVTIKSIFSGITSAVTSWMRGVTEAALE
ncbi:hypothetical protein ACH5RR_020612 [Cinchona calisaya]|uniref:Gamma-interferon-inducible lysosomal thiol reductase n=1 Tax=Cinchona calisaya TaxID=153742 RepID=A0ABD2ZF21_9GENT